MTVRSSIVTTTEDRLRPSRTHHASYVLRELARTMRAAALNCMAGQRVLDYGCGNMPYRPLFLARGVEYIGADLPGNDVAQVQLSIDGRIPLGDASVDMVVSSQVLEHVSEPELYLAEAHRVLKAEGSLVLSTHGYWQYHPHPEDYWRWTHSGLRRVLEGSGFRIVDQQGLVCLPAAALQLWQDAVRPRVPRLVRPVFVLLMQFAVSWQDRLGRGHDRDACVYVVTAVKAIDQGSPTPVL